MRKHRASQTRNLLGIARVGSNPAAVVNLNTFLLSPDYAGGRLFFAQVLKIFGGACCL